MPDICFILNSEFVLRGHLNGNWYHKSILPVISDIGYHAHPYALNENSLTLCLLSWISCCSYQTAWTQIRLGRTSCLN